MFKLLLASLVWFVAAAAVIFVWWIITVSLILWI